MSLAHFSLSITLPCFNEAEVVADTIDDILHWFNSANIDGEVIVVDDGSHDDSANIVRNKAENDARVHLIQHEHNRGYGAAVRTGLNAGTKEWLAFMDSDGQFKARDFEKLIQKTDRYDFITGRKIKRADPFKRRLFAKCYAFLIGIMLGVWVHDINCAMKLFRRNLWPRIRPEYGLGALFNGELYARLKREGKPWKQVWVNHYPRVHGQQTGGNPLVILRMFRELLVLKRRLRKS